MSTFPKIQLKLNKNVKNVKHDEIKADIQEFSSSIISKIPLKLNKAGESNNEKLDIIVNNILVNIITDLLKDISNDYKIDVNELREKYMKNFDKSKTYNLLITKLLQLDKSDHIKLCMENYSGGKSNSGAINGSGDRDRDRNGDGDITIDITKCYARTDKNKQCTRSKKQGDFCGGHIHNLKHGRIDEEKVKSTTDQEIKKRGRPKGGSKKTQPTEDKYVIEETDEGNFLICLEDNKMYDIPEHIEDCQINTQDLVHVGFKVGDEYQFI